VNNLRANEFVLTVKQSRQQAEDTNDKGGKA
jgi:type IV pilus assembly protein PilN